MSDYQDQIARLKEESKGFNKIIQKIDELKDSNARILNFSHHDLDGVTSAVILKRLLERYANVDVTTRMPFEFRLTPDELEEELEGEDYDLLIISDKGTFAYYDDFLDQVNEVMIIDHHLKDGKPAKCIVFNPSLEEEVRASTSLLSHMLAAHFGVADDYDDFIALLGCRGDYIIDPVKGRIPSFAEPFANRARQKFNQLFVKIDDKPTLFDSGAGEKTALLNQVGEVLHVSLLAHLYTPLSEEVNVDHRPNLVPQALSNFAEQEKKLDFDNLQDFLEIIPKNDQISKVFELFKKDWSLLEERAENAIFLEEVEGVGIYLVFSKEAPAMQGVTFPAILPYVASAKLGELTEKGDHEAALTMVFCPKDIGVHISLRGGGQILSCDAIGRKLVERVQERRPKAKNDIGGGGHELAAECVAAKSIETHVVMHELLNIIKDLTEDPTEFEAGSE
ncbi:hypothetical protein AKJ44_01755 [candidate division MSBL1 archaeon SCGC-AAA261F17]|uniref:DDH domain-containing protein n=1 Tax=candidate division MSBL1 archaeon SCGC-AAA261F17 TaxID=1698274 RepID=A0A133V681_9EURY|nr:hypothetical protein AKJ44_01755 [candidate division MSBL1 archaeon SCGC-AAA261F17]